MNKPITIVYVLNVPVQYQSAILRELAAQPGLEVSTFYGYG